MTEHIGLLAQAGKVIAPNIFDLIRSLQVRGNAKPSFADIFNEFYSLDLLDKKQRTGIAASSFGSSVAWVYGADKPKEIDWIVAGSPTGYPLKRSLTEWMAAAAREFVLPPKNKVPRHLKQRDPGPGHFIKRLIQHPPSVIRGFQLSIEADQREEMKNVEADVHLLWGRTDELMPVSSGMEMLKLISNSRLDIVSDYNHIWMAVEPEKLTNPAVAKAKALKK